MIGAVKPLTDDRANYIYVAKFRAAKGELRSQQLQPEVLELYQQYWPRIQSAGGPAPHSFSREDQDELAKNADCLSHVYFNDLRGEILTSAVSDRCAYCFLERAYAVDHYLPKAIFGEYAIFSPNLVPICTPCNGKKLNRYKRKGGGCRYVHPYMNELAGGSTRYLTGVVTINESVVVEFKLVKPDEVDDELWAVVESHFDDLNLLNRFKSEAAHEMSMLLSAIYLHDAVGGAEEIRRALTIQRISRQSVRGANHWWVVLLRALVESAEFCEGGFRALGPNPGEISI